MTIHAVTIMQKKKAHPCMLKMENTVSTQVPAHL